MLDISKDHVERHAAALAGGDAGASGRRGHIRLRRCERPASTAARPARRDCPGGRTSSSSRPAPRPNGAGFRACKRCRPDQAPFTVHADAIAKACRLIDSSHEAPDLATLATAVGPEPVAFSSHLQIADRPDAQGRMRPLIASSGCTSALARAWAAGCRAGKAPGHAAAQVPRPREGKTIRFAVGRCSLGSILVAATEIGVSRSCSATIRMSCCAICNTASRRPIHWRRPRFRPACRPGDRVRRAAGDRLRPSAGRARHRVSTAGLAEAPRDPVRQNDDLREAGRSAWNSKIDPRRRRSLRRQSDRGRDPVPSRRPHRWIALRLPLGSGERRSFSSSEARHRLAGMRHRWYRRVDWVLVRFGAPACGLWVWADWALPLSQPDREAYGRGRNEPFFTIALGRFCSLPAIAVSPFWFYV